MANSNITKKALADALKELMQSQPFDKINVTDICEKCNMNRKSFYYHFKDKYDLVNWIFDTDFISLITSKDEKVSYKNHWELIYSACAYFYENREFYHKALLIDGQNAFVNHLCDYLHPLLQDRLTYLFDGNAIDDFTVNFLADAMLCSIERWLKEKNCMPANQFVKKLHHLIQNGATAVCKEMDERGIIPSKLDY